MLVSPALFARLPRLSPDESLIDRAEAVLRIVPEEDGKTAEGVGQPAIPIGLDGLPKEYLAVQTTPIPQAAAIRLEMLRTVLDVWPLSMEDRQAGFEHLGEFLGCL